MHIIHAVVIPQFSHLHVHIHPATVHERILLSGIPQEQNPNWLLDEIHSQLGPQTPPLSLLFVKLVKVQTW